MTLQEPLPRCDLPPLPALSGTARLRLLPGTLLRLGPRALVALARHRLHRPALKNAPPPAPPFLHDEAAAIEPVAWFAGVPPADCDAPALSVPTAGGFDIRAVWEAGRLGGLAALDPAAAEARVRDFVAANPPFRGPHWACGQEAAIRLAALVDAAAAIGGPPRPGLLALVRLHRQRIAATLDYAIAQDNNHAISEAAGLWAAGLVVDEPATAARGRALLRRAVLRLFLPSGAFAQGSARYHHLALAMVDFAGRTAARHGAPGLDATAAARLDAARAWLAQLGPWRVGHDDGSALLAAALPPAGARPLLDPAGGFAVLRAGTLAAGLRLPVHPFRPAQADALHVELWQGRRSLLLDAGTATYNAAAAPDAPDLARTAAHNTVAFDDDDQMPRLSRFLYAAWLRPATLQLAPDEAGASYNDWRGRRHARTVRLSPGGLSVDDEISGPFRRAVLRWRVAPDQALGWTLDGATLRGPGVVLTIAGADRVRLVRLPFSPRYGTWQDSLALEAERTAPGRFSTRVAVADQAVSA